MIAEDRDCSSVEKVDKQEMRKSTLVVMVARAVSNLQKPIDKTATFTDFFKYEGDFKKGRILEKVRQ